MNTQDYLNFARYENQPVSFIAGFSAFQDQGNGLYYFSMLDEVDGSVILISEGYPSIASRDNGINAVVNNRGLDERYMLSTDDGRYYLALRAANGEEIARTATFNTEAQALAMLPSARKKAAAIAATKPQDKKRDIDDYLPCSAYEGHSRSAINDFTTFEANGKYYFAMVDANGKVMLRSEGYGSIAGRDNGIQSVIANREIKERYITKELSNGNRIKILLAGNQQEIARSCPIKDEPVAVPMPDAVVEPSKFNWWWIFLPLLVLIFLAWRSCSN
ncbi:DUF1508 domain-containing protein [Solitalea koreensis]|uniref:DUF1508 domain-containing protein n=1 Tax=Solitalea koreensis TaxID=543615 RepID=A0A521BZN1_9SPHI|nr:YegP family protein [Solitalea koreensis]SMO52676.1 protein of unknown function [Solitalea koreensis]